MSTSSPTSIAERPSTASRAAAARIQAKLSVSRSDDAYEQEADRAAGVVVDGGATHAGPSAAGGGAPPRAAAAAVATRAVPKISRLAEAGPRRKVQRQEEEKEEAQAKVQRQAEEEEAQAKVQRQEEEREEESQTKLQRQAAEEEETQTRVQRQDEEREEAQTAVERQEEENEEEAVQTKKEARPNVRDKRLYPVLDRVETKLFESKGKGKPLDEETRISMETSFRSDFSGVRIHTGAAAEEMSRELRAQAFTHGKDVFFNAGKYESDTARGRMLLAHELTHVVQQGAADQRLSEERVEKNNAEREQARPEPGDRAALEIEKENEKKVKEGEPEPGKEAAVAGGGAPAGGGAGEAVRAAAPGAEAEETRTEAEAKLAEGEAPAKKLAEAEPITAAKAEPGAARRAEGEAEAKVGVVGEHLRKTTRSVFEAKKAGVSKLAAHQRKTQPAVAKLAHAEKAVVPPAEEAESRAEAAQVETVERAREPEPDEAKAKEEFDVALQDAVPTTLEEVDQFKEAGKGRIVGEKVKAVVTADTQEVTGTYQEIDNPPEPAPSEEEPQELPEMEEAPDTAPLDMGEGVVGEVQAEHTDLGEFDEQTDELLEKEQIEEEHLEMVDEGDLAEAKKDRKTVKVKVQDGPREVKLLEQEEKQKLSRDLQTEEQGGRLKMKEERRKELRGTRDDQKKTKSKIEQKRQQVADRIHAIYEKANTTVRRKLDDLEQKSLREFDEGEKRATQTFEDTVKLRIDAFKRRRYDRLGGSLLWAKDKLFGMDDLPEVKAIFESEKGRFITAIDALVKKITVENRRVVQECKGIVANARKEIETFVRSLGPELRKTGRDALREMKGKLDALDQKIADKEKELQAKLAEKREAAIKAIEKKIEKMKEDMSGLVSKLGNLLLEAMVKFFKWALKKAGYASDQLMGILNKGKEVVKKIVTDPIGFLGNIVKAMRDGIDLFVTNIKKHLIAGLVTWLTGAMADVPITLPTQWDVKGILHLVLQILGLTWDRIRKKLVKRLGEKVVRIAETSVDILKRLISEGPIALWEMLKEKAAEIKERAMQGIRNWVITQVVKQAVIKLVSFLNPAGAIIQAILAIYNTVMFFVENWDRIVQFVQTVFNSIADIAMGKLSAAAQAVERALAMTIPIILNFLARLIGLSGIGKAVTNVIHRIRRPIDKVVDKVIASVANVARGLLKKGEAVAKAAKGRVLSLIPWWKKRQAFRDTSGGLHQLYYKGAGVTAVLMVRSTSMQIEDFLESKKGKTGVREARALYTQSVKPKENQLRRIDTLYKEGRGKKALAAQKQQKAIDENRSLALELEKLHTQLAQMLAKLVSPAAGEYPPPKLPVMADNKKASNLEADFIVKSDGDRFKYGVSEGTESKAHVGNLEGWPELRGAKLTPGAKWVRMHLLPHKLGGHAVDSNLTPARGPENTRFSHAVEQPAIKTAIEKPPAQREPIWYRFTIDYHSHPYRAFPKLLSAEFGTYVNKSGRWERKPAKPPFTRTPAEPELVL